VQITVADGFRVRHPGGVFGALAVRHCPNRPRPLALEARFRAIEERVRRAGPAGLEAHPVARAYAAYYRPSGTRYPVIHQARSILAGRRIESGSALVAAMFAAEVDSLVLTSGHDLTALAGPLTVDVAAAGERYVKLNGREQVVLAGDMVVRDGGGMIACVLYGPDARTRLHAQSADALFGAWAPQGVPAEVVGVHLDGLAALVHLEWPQAVVGPAVVVTASGAWPCPAISTGTSSTPGP
jgi:DNA/RNA-binding domain of Phe-tRNA-synthetase-like protein